MTSTPSDLLAFQLAGRVITGLPNADLMIEEVRS